MTTLDFGPAALIGSGAFEYDNLEIVGVHYAPEQIELFERAQREGALAMYVQVLADPGHPGFYEALNTLSQDGEVGLALLPGVVELSPALSETTGVDADTRFPSIGGQEIIVLSDMDGMGDTEMGRPEAFRLWNLWPIDEDEAGELVDAVRVWGDAYYEPLRLWHQADQGLADVCGLETSVPRRQHDHRPIETGLPHQPVWVNCMDGEHAFEKLKQTYFRLDDDGMLAALPLPAFLMSNLSLQRRWEQLLLSSRRNTAQALTAIVPWELDAVRDSERRYSPWLWLS